ncbi:UDP-3-O-(3-hydroxymyristoyl)glucosamine N-acyltransferase [bacterium]|nr:UDP-3-O-(3-hydroxymyristoyl)glucosamine N-acyltransferase [bacterium]
MQFTAAQLAEFLDGIVFGDEGVQVDHLCKIEEGGPRGLSFLANPQYTPYIYRTQASVVIVSKDFQPDQPISATLIAVDDPYQSFARLLEHYDQTRPNRTGIEQPVSIDPSASIGEDAYIGAFAYIGRNVQIGRNARIHPQVFIGDNVRIGDEVQIYPGVRIYHDTVIGNHVTLHAGVVLGGDGFGFAPNQTDSYNKVAQIGNVVVEDGVEIGANSTIDRATLGSTILRKGVKLDNLIQIAHNVEIGENTVMAAQSGVAGSTKIGANCMIGGQVGIVGHITIGNRVRIAAQSGVGQSLPDGAVVQGSPAFDFKAYQRAYVYFRKLPQWMRGFTANPDTSTPK